MADKSYSFSKKFIEGETASGFWNIAYYGIVTLNSFIILRFLEVYEYGLYQLIIAVIATAESLIIGFLDDLVLTDLSRYLGRQEKSLAKRIFKEYALMRIFLAALATAVLMLGAEVISHYYRQDIALFVRIASLALIFRIGLSVMNMFFNSSLYFSAFGAPVFGEVIKLGAIFGLWHWYGLGISQIIIAYVVGHAASFIFAGVHFCHWYANIFKGIKAAKESLIKAMVRLYGPWMGLRYALSRVTNNLRPWVMRIFVSTEAVGLFSFAQSLFAMIARLMPLGMLGNLMPRELDNKPRLKYIFSAMVKYAVFLSLAGAVISLITVPLLVGLIFPKYLPAMPLFRIMTTIIFLYGFYKIFRMTLVVFKEQKVLVLRSLDGSVLSPLILFILLPIFGIKGAAIEWVLTYAVTTILFYHYLVKLHPYLKLRLKNFYPNKHDIQIIRQLSITAFQQIKSRLRF